MTVEWRSVVGWPYEVSSDGRVRRLAGRELKQISRDTYLCVSLSRGSSRWRPAIHQLVCSAFHGPCPSANHEVAHGDGNPRNNNAANLRWATVLENAADRGRHGRNCDGERNGSARINAETAHAIRRDKGRLVEIAARHGISVSQTHRIRSGQSWRCLFSEMP